MRGSLAAVRLGRHGAGRAISRSEIVARARVRVFKSMTGDSLAFTQAKEIPMSDPTDVQNSFERMMSRMDLRGLRPNTVSTFAM